MNITFYDFKQLHPAPFLQEIEARFKEILHESSFIEGKYNLQLEKRLCEYLKSKHCRLLANCTDALEIALVAYDVKPGDYVGVTGISFHASAEAIVNVSAIPVLIDVDPITGLMDPQSLSRMIEKFPLKAIIPVHIYGMPAPMAEIEKICRPKNIKIVEDAAQAIGAYFPDGRPVGSGSNLVTFSFYPTKNLGAFGDAGAILSDDEEMIQKVSYIRNHGRSAQGLLHFGRNSRCDHLQAAVLDLKLGDLEHQNDQRKVVAAKYMEKLQNLAVEFPAKNFVRTSSWHLFPMLVPSKEHKIKLRDFLKERGIQSQLFYERALGDEIPMQQYQGEKEQARKFAERVICLPIHPFINEDQINYVVQSIVEFFDHH